MKTDIEKLFNDHLSEKFKVKPDVKRYLLQHERKQVCLNNLCEQIILAENRLITFNLDKWKSMIRTTADMFASAALKLAEERSVSSIERIRRATEADRDNELERILADLRKEGAIADRTTVRSMDGTEEVQSGEEADQTP